MYYYGGFYWSVKCRKYGFRENNMVQFYFLSVMLNLLIGVMLVFNTEDSAVSKILDTENKIFQLVTGILSVFVALVKLLSPVGGVLFFGDFIPAVAGFAGGACVLIHYFYEKAASDVPVSDSVRRIFIENQKYIGIVCFICAVVHFICPAVLFL